MRRSTRELLWTALYMGIARAFLFAWTFMLTIGVVHGEWLTMMPTIGFWSSLILGMLISSTAAAFQFGSNLTETYR